MVTIIFKTVTLNYTRKTENITEERRKLSAPSSSFVSQIDSTWVERFSSFSKLQRVMVLFKIRHNATSNKDSRKHGPLSSVELLNSRSILIKLVQSQFFQQENVMLKETKRVNHSSRFASVAPFLDHDMIRVR